MSESSAPTASSFQPSSGEANFGPILDREVVGGMHIAPECITTFDSHFVMARRQKGLPRHDDGETVRFPHGLMNYGESIEDCAARLTLAQFGMYVDDVRVLSIYSYLDEYPHWHFEPLLHVALSSKKAQIPNDVDEIIRHNSRTLPPGSVWSPGTFEEVFDKYFSHF